MDTKNYITNAIRTEIKDYQPVSNRFTPEFARLFHAIFGLELEMQELKIAIEKNDINNIIEELGDIAWYLAILFDILKINPNVLFGIHTNGNEFEELNKEIFELCDNSKKYIFYGKELKELPYKVNFIWERFCFFCCKKGIDISLILQKNIDKLKARFPNAYSDENAINRNLDKEYNAFKINN